MTCAKLLLPGANIPEEEMRKAATAPVYVAAMIRAKIECAMKTTLPPIDTGALSAPPSKVVNDQ